MLNLTEYVTYDALGLGSLVKSGEVTPNELMECALDTIDRINPALNAIAHLSAKRPDEDVSLRTKGGVFDGVPFLLKDTPPMASGVQACNGSRFFKGLTRQHDTELMARFRRVGLQLLGTTTVPEFSSADTTQSELYGITSNPWNEAFSVGGSSGGAAAAVASGMVPVAHGGDGGGSIRGPASMNGLVGLKPTRGRVPNGPDRGHPAFGTAEQFALTRSVRDSAALLDAIAGPDVGCYAHVSSPTTSFSEALQQPTDRLRIAWMNTSFDGTPSDPECRSAVAAAASHCEGFGHELVEILPEVNMDSVSDAISSFHMSNIAFVIADTAARLGRPPQEEEFEPHIWDMYQRGIELRAVDIVEAVSVQNRISRLMGEFFSDFDALLLPTLPRSPLRNRDVAAGFLGDKTTNGLIGTTNTTSVFNLTGLPAISVPQRTSEDGVPIGVQFAAGLGGETTLIKLARQMELAEPWERRRQDMVAKRLDAVDLRP